MNKETAFSSDQQALIVAAAVDLFKSVDLAGLKNFLIMYAWQKAEKEEAAETTLFELESSIDWFTRKMREVVPPQ